MARVSFPALAWRRHRSALGDRYGSDRGTPITVHADGRASGLLAVLARGGGQGTDTGTVVGVVFAALMGLFGRWLGNRVLRPRLAVVIGAAGGMLVWTALLNVSLSSLHDVGWNLLLISASIFAGIGALSSALITTAARRGALPVAPTTSKIGATSGVLGAGDDT